MITNLRQRTSSRGRDYSSFVLLQFFSLFPYLRNAARVLKGSTNELHAVTRALVFPLS